MKKILSEMQEKEIIYKYINGINGKKLANQYGVSSVTIYKTLQKNGIPRRSQTECQRKYELDETFFDNIDTEEKAYFLGLMFADGSNNTERHELRISLIEPDGGIIEKFASALKTNIPIKYRIIKGTNRHNQHQLSITSKHMSEQLAKLGCVQAKTYILEFPKYLPENLINHFLRGYCDGDGHIGFTGHIARFEIVGTENFCAEVEKIFKEKCGINCFTCARHPERHNTIRQLHVNGNQQIIKALNYIYKDATVYLERKYKKYLGILELNRTIHKKEKRFCKICGAEIKVWKYCKKCYYRNFQRETRRRYYERTGR